MKEKLTDGAIRAAKPKLKRYAMTDSDVTGLQLEITPRYVRTWYFRGSVIGRRQRVRLGRYPGLMLSDARKAARDLTGQAAKNEQLPTSGLS